MGRFKNKADMIDSISNEAKVSKDAARKVLTNRSLETVLYLEQKLAVANAIIKEKEKYASSLMAIASSGRNPFDFPSEESLEDSVSVLKQRKKRVLSEKQLKALSKGRNVLKKLRKEVKKRDEKR